MTSIKQWATIVCISAIIACLTDMLTPSGKMKKTVQLVLGLFMLCAVFIPLINTVKNFSTELNKITTGEVNNDFQQNVQNDFSNQATIKIEQLATELLQKNNIEYKKIEAYMDINEDFSISIIKITVTIDLKDISIADTIKQLLENNLGIETIVETL